MHDAAERYYENAIASIDRTTLAIKDLLNQLMEELFAQRVAFDAEWTRRMRDFKGEVPSPPHQPPSTLDQSKVVVVSNIIDGEITLDKSEVVKNTLDSLT